MINRQQCSLIWHAADLKFSHNKKFVKYIPLTTTRGKGLTIYYMKKGKVQMSIFYYINY